MNVEKVTVAEHEGYVKNPFPGGHRKLNPLQARFVSIPGDRNVVVAAPTSAGKTLIAEIAFHQAIRRGEKCIYLSPLKAVAEEKYRNWTNRSHPFSRVRTAIATGDYLDPSRRDAVLARCAKSDITVMTSELLDSLTRRGKVSRWFERVGCLVVDEAHLLGVPQRGSALECALLRFSEQSRGRLLFLSATIPNADDMAGWLSRLNGRRSVLLLTEWRPVSLNVEIVPYETPSKYVAEYMVERIDEIVSEYSGSDSILIFVHSKRFGRKLASHLKCRFHNANLDLSDRSELLRGFLKGEERVLVATSTLAWGVNLPARRVIVAGIYRGMERVPIWDIKQMCGRAGRAGYNARGDAYILVPEEDEGRFRRLYESGWKVESRLTNTGELAFHLVNEIYNGCFSVGKLQERFRASFKSPLPIAETVKKLVESNAVIEEGSGRLKVTAIGKTAALFYYDPFMIANLYSNLRNVPANDDKSMAWAIGDCLPDAYVPGEVRDEIESSIFKICPAGIVRNNKEVNIYCLYKLFTGKEIVPEVAHVARSIKYDFERLTQALKYLAGTTGLPHNFDIYNLMVRYGVPREVAMFCKLPGIGAARARALYDAGLKSIEDIRLKPALARQVLKENLYSKISAHLESRG